MLSELACHAHLLYASSLVLILFLLCLQVEYYPLSSIEKSRAIMEDFFDIWQETVAKKSLPGHFIHVESNFSEYGLSDQYSFQHTAVQYATCLQQLMTAVRGQLLRLILVAFTGPGCILCNDMQMLVLPFFFRMRCRTH